MEADIRGAAPADEDDIVRLLLQQLADHGVDAAGDRLRGAVQHVLADGSLGSFLLACRSGQVVGVAYMSLPWSMEHAGRCAWLEELYVLPTYRGRGIGRSLLRRVLQEARARECTAVDLEVDSAHARAERFYQGEGFANLPRRRWVKPLAPL